MGVSPVAPLGLGVVGIRRFYKHVAPLGLVVMRKEKRNADLRSLRMMFADVGLGSSKSERNSDESPINRDRREQARDRSCPTDGDGVFL